MEQQARPHLKPYLWAAVFSGGVIGLALFWFLRAGDKAVFASILYSTVALFLSGLLVFFAGVFTKGAAREKYRRLGIGLMVAAAMPFPVAWFIAQAGFFLSR
ncbi:MAG: hypothetical protein GC185_03935 [Alphaproteobacteria bacterium]|nr:hypothetical protein [Alphaproteobacteria bacterium]